MVLRCMFLLERGWKLLERLVRSSQHADGLTFYQMVTNRLSQVAVKLLSTELMILAQIPLRSASCLKNYWFSNQSQVLLRLI